MGDQIPDKSLDGPRGPSFSSGQGAGPPASLEPSFNPLEETEETDEDEQVTVEADGTHERSVTTPRRIPPRRLSTYESADGVMDLESDVVGGSARR